MLTIKHNLNDKIYLKLYQLNTSKCILPYLILNMHTIVSKLISLSHGRNEWKMYCISRIQRWTGLLGSIPGSTDQSKIRKPYNFIQIKVTEITRNKLVNIDNNSEILTIKCK